MISSLYCADSEPNVYKHYKWLTRWNANQCYSLRITYLIFETFQLFFEQLHWFLQLWWFSSSDISGRMKHKASRQKWRLTCYILWRLTWNETKVVNKLSRVCGTDWKSTLNGFLFCCISWKASYISKINLMIKWFSFECWKYPVNYFSFRFIAVWDRLSSLIGKWLVWFWCKDTQIQALHCKQIILIFIFVFPLLKVVCCNKNFCCNILGWNLILTVLTFWTSVF